MAHDKITVRGARVHNLKNVNVEIPRDQLVVITGLSGSGKSSLAFDTIFAEGQRRYVESLSAYARQFLGQMDKPDVDSIDGLSPAVSIDQKGASHNPRSTVGTVTEIYDHLRLMFARIGVQTSPVTGLPLVRQSAQSIVDTLAALPSGTRLQILAPIIREKKGHHTQVFEDVRKQGFVRVRVDGEVRDVNENFELDRYKIHNIEIVVDRLVVQNSNEANDASLAENRTQNSDFMTRLTDSVEQALKLGDGFIIVIVEERNLAPAATGQSTRMAQRAVSTSKDLVFSEKRVDPATGISYPDLEPRHFSFNAPDGACSECQGLGSKQEFDPALIIPNPDLSVEEGAIVPFQSADDEGYYVQLIHNVCRHFHIPLNTAWNKLREEQRNALLYGTPQGAALVGNETRIKMQYVNRAGENRTWDVTWEGVLNNMMRRYRDSSSDYVRQKLEEYMTHRECPACGGKRLKDWILAVRIASKNIHEVCSMSIRQALDWVNGLGLDQTQIALPSATNIVAPPMLSERDRKIAGQIVKEIRARLQFLVDVGLDYLNLSRAAMTLSGGESQRIRLATQVGSQLMGVLYVLDEPSIGLHQRDQERLIHTLKKMRDLGNTVLVVEHDDDTMRAADWIIDMGPGAGEHGGRVVATGTVAHIEAHDTSLTGAYLSGRKAIPVPVKRRPGNGKWIVVKGAQENNLKNVDVEIPLGKFVVITGVSGSGKSSLVVECLYKSLANKLNGALERPGKLDDVVITGEFTDEATAKLKTSVAMNGRFTRALSEALDKVINIDQQPIGRTPRSNPATYTGLWSPLRDLFAELPESKLRGYKSGRFSFNVKGGRCEACEGQGVLQIQMQFMPDVYVQCEECKGSRFNRETLQVRFKGKNIAEVLDMTHTEAYAFFKDIPSISRKLDTLIEVGLGYVKLGQPATTLSGGEAQRVKLSRELSKRATGRTIYVLDEPSVGLHQADVHKLIEVLNRLVDDGNTVVVIEHHLDIIKVADWIIDMGPEGGEGGGRVVAQGTPEDITVCSDSYTGRFLRHMLERRVIEEGSKLTNTTKAAKKLKK
jgi:excinuclease ABC subunit A